MPSLFHKLYRNVLHPGAFQPVIYLLHTFARHIVKDSSVAEDIIQNVFVKMWMRKEQVNPELSVRNYLLVATRNELFDYMRLRYNMLRSDINDMHDLVEGDVRFSEQFVMGE